MAIDNLSCDVFCDVIDNYGDAGICWRLAFDLVQRNGWKVRLFINNLETLSEIVPEVNPNVLSQEVNGIEVDHWDLAYSAEPSKVVLETFGCKIPESFEKRIASSPLKPVWINLEYFSAEDWIEGCHLLPSIHPLLGYTKYYFYPGVTKKTGGVIIEDWLSPWQKEFKEGKSAFLRSFNATSDEKLNLLVFCYSYSPLGLLLQALLEDARPTQLLLAGGRAFKEIEKIAGDLPSFLNIVKLPMVAQTDFDRLMWSADCAVVRGEDSFIRAQLAAVPFIWTPYAQEKNVHITKLLAFSEKFRKFEPTESIGNLWEQINLAWNQQDTKFIPLWAKWRNNLEILHTWSDNWRKHLYSLQSLTINLCNFLEEKIESCD